MSAHDEMARMKTAHPDWIWNHGDTHVFIAPPHSLDAFKTPVEPGNSFSPGPCTFGVSTWIFTDGKLHSPERMKAEDLRWRWEDGHIPVLHCDWRAGNLDIKSILFTSREPDGAIRDYLTIRICSGVAAQRRRSAGTPLHGKLFLTLRSFGASGGPVSSLCADPAANAILVNNRPAVIAETDGVFRAVSYEKTGKDISQFLQLGELPADTQVDDPSKWASGVIAYDFELQAGESATYDFAFPLHAGHWTLADQSLPACPLEVTRKREQFIEDWKNDLRIGLDLPDKRFSEAMFAQIAALRQFMVCDSPRISPVSYPLFWLRDGSYIVNALDKAGRHDDMARAIRAVKDRDSFGGFGAEGDGPAMMIWMISEHYLLTRDRAFLEEMWPAVERLAALIIRMRNTDAPIRSYPEILIPQMQSDPSADILCLASKDGLIQGRMDHHIPLFWINSFAWLALRRSAELADESGHNPAPYHNEAAALLAALQAKAPQIFGKNERDVNVAFWPSGWALENPSPIINARFDEFWKNTRNPMGVYTPEPLWTYFEAGQAHNQLLAGHPDRAWVSIEHFLSNHTAQGLYTYHEGNQDENSSGLWQRARGWDEIRHITPHGWTSAELFLLLRDCLVHETADGLVIGAGIPASWRDRDFAVTNLPTHFGPVSFTHRADEKPVLEI
ncbi:MAG: hypothetical protein FWG05_04870, partial [Kiritimatiellaeota bacterium]|nr:hypothetical protein [Kiritimatiellota bacterium]